MRNLLLISGIFLTFLNITAGAGDSSCSELCNESKCEKPVISCDSGVFVKDECDCCNVCLRSLNQICGGLHARFGICEKGLECGNDNSEAFLNDENADEEDEEDDVIGLCQAITFYISLRFTNTYGKDVVLKTNMKPPYDSIDVVSGRTFHETLDVPRENVTFEAFVKDSEDRIRINDEDVFVMKPQQTQPQEATVLELEQHLVAQDCVLASWSQWSKCSEKCGFGTMKRRRRIIQIPKNGGAPCPIRHEKKGCFQQKCKGDIVLAQILPAEYRRGANPFENILPQKKELTEIQKIRKGFRSHCVNFKLMSKHPYCEGTWAEKLKLSKPMCVECQPSIMDDQGFCKGEGIAGNFTSWVATNAKKCNGLWMRVGEKIPNCKCVDQKFQNFIFV